MSISVDRVLIELAFEGIKFDSNFDILNYRHTEVPPDLYFKIVVVNGAREMAGRRVYNNLSLGKSSDIIEEDLKYALDGFEHHYINLMNDTKFSDKEILKLGLEYFAKFREEWL